MRREVSGSPRRLVEVPCSVRGGPYAGLTGCTSATRVRAGSVLIMAGRIRPAGGYTGRMTETTLYQKLLGIERPWRVRDVRLAP